MVFPLSLGKNCVINLFDLRKRRIVMIDSKAYESKLKLYIEKHGIDAQQRKN